MARTQALMIQIATGDPRPISKQIVDAIRMKIATAELARDAQVQVVECELAAITLAERDGLDHMLGGT